MTDSGIHHAKQTEPSVVLQNLWSKKVVIVDDLFEPPKHSDVNEDRIAEFVLRCNHNSEMLEAFVALGKLQSRRDGEITRALQDDDLLQELWVGRHATTPLAEACRETIFFDSLLELEQITPLCSFLRGIGFTVIELWNEDQEIPEDVGLLFLDYLLGKPAHVPDLDSVSDAADESSQNNIEVIRKSQKIVDRLHRNIARDADKPFVVLISSQSSVPYNEYIRETRWLRGMFDFVPKSELSNINHLEHKIRSWNASLPTRHKIQHFVEAITAALDRVAEEFRKSLTDLSYQDYNYIQLLALESDGHPLGDYMLQLYACRLEQMFATAPEVRDAQTFLDPMTFDNFIPSESSPSREVSTLYQSMLSVPVEPLGKNPRNQKVDDFQLGDVFIKDASRVVLMVLNPACDLTSRVRNHSQPIFFIPGTLHSLVAALSSEQMAFPRTELLSIGEHMFRVLWRNDLVFSWPRSDVSERMNISGYHRRFRLRLPYALLVQQAFANRFTRVGLPVAPPIYTSADVRMFCKDREGNGALIGAPIAGGAIVFHRKDGEKFVEEYVLTGSCTRALKDQLTVLASQNKPIHPDELPRIKIPKKGRPDENDDEKSAAAEKARLEKYQRELAEPNKFETLRDNHEFWFSLISKVTKMPALRGEGNVAPGLINLYRGVDLTTKWENRPFIAISIDQETPDDAFESTLALAEPTDLDGAESGPDLGFFGQYI